MRKIGPAEIVKPHVSILRYGDTLYVFPPWVTNPSVYTKESIFREAFLVIEDDKVLKNSLKVN